MQKFKQVLSYIHEFQAAIHFLFKTS